MQKNDELILKIEDMGVDGAGIGKADGRNLEGAVPRAENPDFG